MTQPATGLLQYEVSEQAARITLNRPEKLNALSHALVDELSLVLDRAAADDAVKVIVLSGAGRAFCAGYDLTEEVNTPVADADAWHRLLSRDATVTLQLLKVPKPTIAAVRGYCLAGGCDLAMACDIVIATEDASFGEPEIRYGSGPVTMLMPFLIGQKKTNELLFTGDVISASESQRLGLVNRVVPLEQLDAEVDGLAAQIALTPLPVLRYTKLGILRAYQAMGLDQAVASNVELSTILNASETPEQRQFYSIAARDGLGAALAWRDERYGRIAT